MKKHICNIGLALVFALMLSGVALASAETPVPTFETLDGNADGQISKEEAQVAEMQSEVFEMADVNMDNMLDKNEYALVDKK